MGGAQIFFRCNPGYVPAGRMSATCVSPDGISAVGTWTRDPANLVCNGEIHYMGQLIYCNIIVNSVAVVVTYRGMCFTIALFPGPKLGNKANFT